MEKRAVKKSIQVHAPASEVWRAITDPEMVKKYFFGTNVESDWKKGSPITYSGIWKGKEYRDKGEILEIEKEKKLSHTHWSSLSGTPAEAENFFTVTYELEPRGEDTVVSVVQTGLMSQETYDHSGENWDMVLNKMKELLEKVPV